MADFQSKCAHYWPDDGEIKEYEGGFKLLMQKESSTPDFTLREFLMTRSGEERVIYQFHFIVSYKTKFSVE